MSSFLAIYIPSPPLPFLKTRYLGHSTAFLDDLGSLVIHSLNLELSLAVNVCLALCWELGVN